MTVASVDADGRTVLIGLPRNMERVRSPSSSPLHGVPKGFYCKDRSCMLNAVYTYATNHRNLYPGVKNPGAQATKEAIEGATGLEINYWVVVDLKGFEALVDAVGGITMDVYRRVPIGGGHAKLYGYVEAGRNRHLDGREALWFARSRSDSSDYDRMVRQKCVMNAMLNQLDRSRC
jgi:LCP family protein required for cell wall assembly